MLYPGRATAPTIPSIPSIHPRQWCKLQSPYIRNPWRWRGFHCLSFPISCLGSLIPATAISLGHGRNRKPGQRLGIGGVFRCGITVFGASGQFMILCTPIPFHLQGSSAGFRSGMIIITHMGRRRFVRAMGARQRGGQAGSLEFTDTITSYRHCFSREIGVHQAIESHCMHSEQTHMGLHSNRYQHARYTAIDLSLLNRREHTAAEAAAASGTRRASKQASKPSKATAAHLSCRVLTSSSPLAGPPPVGVCRRRPSPTPGTHHPCHAMPCHAECMLHCISALLLPGRPVGGRKGMLGFRRAPLRWCHAIDE